MSENSVLKPEVIVFAGPNGSGKSTVTKMAKIKGMYINADEIKKSTFCTDLEAAQKAEQLRNLAVTSHADFTFETVLSTDRNLELLKHAKNEGYFVRGIYVLTADPSINVSRVKMRVLSGGHDVPEEKILKRYERALELIPQFVDVCDVVHIYDNTVNPFRIFKKRKTVFYRWCNDFWSEQDIAELTGINDFADLNKYNIRKV